MINSLIRTSMRYTPFVVLMTCACTFSKSDEIVFADMNSAYTLITEGIDEDRIFSLVLTSKTDSNLCISVNDWPNSQGEVSGGGSRARVLSGQADYPAKDVNFGSCVGPECTLRVSARSSVRGFIRYREFGDPGRIAALNPKELQYKIRPYFC